MNLETTVPAARDGLPLAIEGIRRKFFREFYINKVLDSSACGKRWIVFGNRGDKEKIPQGILYKLSYRKSSRTRRTS